MEHSRRKFIQNVTLGAAGAIGAPSIAISRSYTAAGLKPENRLPVGIAGYTFAKFDLEKSIAMMRRIAVQNLSLKEFHLPLNSNEEKVKSVMSQFSAANIN